MRKNVPDCSDTLLGFSVSNFGAITGTVTGLKKGLVLGNLIGGSSGLLLGLGLLALPGVGQVVLSSAIAFTHWLAQDTRNEPVLPSGR